MNISLKKTLTTVLTIGIIGFCSNFSNAQGDQAGDDPYEGENGNPCRCHTNMYLPTWCYNFL